MRSFGALVIVLSLAMVEGKADEAAADFIHQARAFREKGDYSRAEQVLRAGIEATGKASTENNRLAELPFLLNTLGDLLREENRGAEARALFERALGSREASWQQKFSALMGIADIERMARSWPESIGHWNEAAELARQHGDPTVEAFALRGLGDTWLDQADTARAEPLLKRALSVLERSPSVTPERLAIAIDSLAALYRAENKLQLAEQLWMRELTIDRTAVGENHPQTAIVKGRLADALSVMGDYDSAKHYAAEAVDSMKSHFGDDSMATG
ncbi:MAG TPA: tetratricopeptide repeat protein, partial [Bryobacteraceae bacterium]|nr:tetratricopeptide repeat protein [Bryobacteraceae bacterium]